MVVRLGSVILKVGFEVEIIVRRCFRASLLKLKNKYVVFMHLSMFFSGGGDGKLDALQGNCT